MASTSPHGEHNVELGQVFEAQPQEERQLGGGGHGGGEGGRGCLCGQLHCHAHQITGGIVVAFFKNLLAPTELGFPVPCKIAIY